jgi:hypothetical protein
MVIKETFVEFELLKSRKGQGGTSRLKEWYKAKNKGRKISR